MNQILNSMGQPYKSPNKKKKIGIKLLSIVTLMTIVAGLLTNITIIKNHIKSLFISNDNPNLIVDFISKTTELSASQKYFVKNQYKISYSAINSDSSLNINFHSPYFDSAHILPPCSSIIVLAINKPNPELRL